MSFRLAAVLGDPLLLLGDDVLRGKATSPQRIARAQAFATLAIAEAIERLAGALEARSGS